MTTQDMIARPKWVLTSPIGQFLDTVYMDSYSCKLCSCTGDSIRLGRKSDRDGVVELLWQAPYVVTSHEAVTSCGDKPKQISMYPALELVDEESQKQLSCHDFSDLNKHTESRGNLKSRLPNQPRWHTH